MLIFVSKMKKILYLKLFFEKYFSRNDTGSRKSFYKLIHHEKKKREATEGWAYIQVLSQPSKIL